MNELYEIKRLLEKIELDGRSPLQNTGLHVSAAPSFGKTMTLVANQLPQDLARVQLERDDAYTVSLDVTGSNGFDNRDIAPTSRLYVWVNLQYGNGASQIQKRIQIASHMELSIIASTIQLSGYIGDADGKLVKSSALNPLPTAQLTCSIAKGVTSYQNRPTIYVPGYTNGLRLNASGGPTRLAAVRGYNTTNTALTVMGFDVSIEQAVGAGSIPIVAIPAPAFPGYFDVSFFENDGIAFQSGLAWFVSTDPTQLAASGSNVRIETQLYLL